jgi:hypothetical protein
MSTGIAREAALLVLRLRLGVDIPLRPLRQQGIEIKAPAAI